MRLSINLSLQTRIGLFVLLGLATGLALFSWLGIQSLNESTDRTLQERLTIARIVAQHMDETLTYVLVQVRSAIDFGEELPTEGQFRPVAHSLREVLAESGIVAPYIILLDTNGHILQAEPERSGMVGSSMSGYAEVNEALETGSATVSGLVSTPVIGTPVVLATAPILNAEGVSIGALSAAIDISRSNIGAFSEPIILGDTGYTEIVDGNGLIIARTEPGQPPEAFETSDHPGRFAELIREGKATVRTCHRCHGPEDQPERRKDVLAFAPLSTASWGIAIRQSEEEALGPTRELQKRLLILGAILLGSASLMMWILVRGLVKPIRILTAASERVASGDFEATIPIKRRDEIGQLGSAFNSMTKELARQRDELVSRTEDLSTLNSISTMVSQSLELEEVLAKALQKVLEVTKTQAGCVFLLGPTGNSLEMKSRINLPSVFDCRESGSSETPCACHQALRWGETQLVDDVSQCPVLNEDAVAKNSINCFVSIPLKSTRRVLGVMNVASTGDRYFTESDFRLLDSIGYHVGLAIDNSILYEEARQKEELRGQLLDGVISAQEEERKRIARELHDEYGQTLTGLIWSIESVEHLASAEQSQLKEKLQNAKSIASHALEVMRRLTFDLRPPALDDLGLTAAIRSYAQTHLEAVGVHVDLETEGLGRRLSSSVEIALFRIVQEAVHNVAKHAEAQTVRIQLALKDDNITAVVEDDGKGFDVDVVFKPGGKARPLGLLGIRERAALLSGTVDVESKAGEGTRLTVVIPIESAMERGVSGDGAT